MKKNYFTIILFSLLILPFFISAQEYKWANVAIGGGGFVSGIITSKTQENVMYARTDVGGAYKWNPDTKIWMPLQDWVSEDETGYLGVDALAIDPQDNDKLYMLVGISYFNNGKTAILKSSDGGNTFEIFDVSSQFKTNGNGMGRQNGERLAVDPNQGNILFCGTRANGLFKSTNEGETWTRTSGLDITTTPSENGVNFILFDPATGHSTSPTQTMYAGVSRTGANIFKSLDGGNTFSAIPGGPEGLMPQRAVLASDENLYITYASHEGPWNPETGAIWKVNPRTSTWTNITPAGTTFPYSGISVDPENPKRLIVSTINVYNTQAPGIYGDRFFLSNDGGATWRDLVGNGINIDADGITWIDGQSIHWTGCIEFNPFNTNQAMVTSGNGIFICEDLEAPVTKWKFFAKGIDETVPLDLVSIPGGPLVSVIGDYDGFVHTDLNAYSPIHNPAMGTSTGIAYAALKPESMVRVGNKMYRTSNQGSSWTEMPMNGLKGRIALSADGSVILHCPEKSSVTYRTDNNGATWTTVTGLNITEAVPVADPVDPKNFYVYNPVSGNMMVSTDGGVSFSSSGSAGNAGAKNIRTVPEKEGHLWVALNAGGLARSVNSATSFTKIQGVSACNAVGLGKAVDATSYHTIYIWGTVGNKTGIFQSTDEGLNWTRINDDEHEYGGPGNGQFIVGDMNVFGRVYMSTAGRGIVYGEPSTISSIENAESVTYEGEKVACYPSPFTNELTIKAKGEFEYFIFDLSGNKLEEGKGFDITSAGELLKTGTYIFKVKTNEHVRHLKSSKL